MRAFVVIAHRVQWSSILQACSPVLVTIKLVLITMSLRIIAISAQFDTTRGKKCCIVLAIKRKARAVAGEYIREEPAW